MRICALFVNGFWGSVNACLKDIFSDRLQGKLLNFLGYLYKMDVND